MNTDEEKLNTVDYHLEVKDVIEKLLTRLGISFEEVEVFKGFSEAVPKFTIKTEESGILIGHHGEHLKAINHLTKKIILKKNGTARFIIDINNYQEEHANKIRNSALLIAQKVKDSGVDIEMDPMSSYERMIIHSLFLPDNNIQTESVGEKNQRRVVIKLKTK